MARAGMGPRLPSSSLPPSASAPQGLVRFTSEAIVLLAMTVTIFRAFFAEGYMISTGSMAPSLLGYHRQVCCSACRYQFARGAAGVAEDASQSVTASTAAEPSDPWQPVTTRCPLCGSAVSETGIPRTEGDQLMVHKHHFDFRDPVRWEVVVFRNPQHPTQAYVKRVVGLPGETIELIDGDVYADGVLQRKPLAVQRSLRIPVDDFAHQPAQDDPDWQPRWRVASENSPWQTDGMILRYRPSATSATSLTSSGTAGPAATSADDLNWVQYRHWVRAGGHHRCRVPLDHWPARTAEPGLVVDGFRYDAAARELESVGAIPHHALTAWLERLPTPEAQDALRELYRQSHQPPLDDRCAYNPPDVVRASSPIHDLMVELELTVRRRAGRFVVAMHDGCHELQCGFDFTSGTARLTANGNATVHRSAPLPEALLAGRAVRVTMSLFDRQALVAVDGVELFAPLPYAGMGPRPPLPPVPVRFGAEGTELDVSGLRLDRDVYYTTEAGQEGRQYVLGPDEFFVLGDNSPVSLDSRAWPHPAIRRELLIGKPFIVHLPSRSQPLRWGEKTAVLRVPDFSRVRYIH